jgi:hypothetical protein
MSDQTVEDAEGIGTDDELVMIRAEVPGDDAGVIELIVASVFEADRERADRARRRARHQTNDQAGVHAAGEKRSERHLAHQVRPDRVL